MNLEWMAWTVPTATFFITIFLTLTGMTIWQVLSPTPDRKGFLPISTTRGDRLFIGLLSSAYINLAWLGFTEMTIWISFIAGLVWMAIVMKWA